MIDLTIVPTGTVWRLGSPVPGAALLLQAADNPDPKAGILVIPPGAWVRATFVGLMTGANDDPTGTVGVFLVYREHVDERGIWPGWPAAGPAVVRCGFAYVFSPQT